MCAIDMAHCVVRDAHSSRNAAASEQMCSSLHDSHVADHERMRPWRTAIASKSVPNAFATGFGFFCFFSLLAGQPPVARRPPGRPGLAAGPPPPLQPEGRSKAWAWGWPSDRHPLHDTELTAEHGAHYVG